METYNTKYGNISLLKNERVLLDGNLNTGNTGMRIHY